MPNITDAQLNAVINLLRTIAELGGNQSNKNLESRTGPNDAVARGIMYTASRQMAVVALKELGQPVPDMVKNLFDDTGCQKTA